MGVIYLRTNLVNGMQYVGQSQNLYHRDYQWNRLDYKYGNELLTKDRREYGLEAFETTILKECDNSELNDWERYYIKELNTLYPNGYNDNEGGRISFHHSERTKQKISEANKGKIPYNKGKTFEELFDEETAARLRKILSDYGKTRTGEKNPFYKHTFKVHPMKNKHHSEETKKKIGEKNRNGKLSTPIIQIKDNGEVIDWASEREAARNGYDCGSISLAVRGIYKKCGHHYKGSYWYTKEEYLIILKMLEEELTS